MRDVSAQLLRAVRGGRSQEAFSRRLGYTSNPVAGWEAGRRFPAAAEFLRACVLSGIDAPAIFAAFLGEPLGEPLDDGGVARWLSKLSTQLTHQELAARTGASRYQVGRWLSGQSKPRLPDFLSLIEGATGRLAELVAALVPIAQVPALLAAHERIEQARRLAFEQPWTEAILRLLETAPYARLPAHRPGWLAARLGVSLAAEAAGLEALEASGLIQWDGGRYRIVTVLATNTQATKREMVALGAHWTEVTLARRRAPRHGDVFGYNVLSVSEADLPRLRALTSQYFQDVRALVAGSEPEEVAALLLVSLTLFDDRPLRDLG